MKLARLLILMSIFLFALIVVGEKCSKRNKGTGSEAPPVVKTTTQQIKAVDQHEGRIARLQDSIRVLERKVQDSTKYWKSNYFDQVRDYNDQERIFNDILNSYPADSSDVLRREFERLRAINAKKDKGCQETTASLQREVDLKAVQVRVSDSSYKVTRASFDSAMQIQDTLTGYIQKIRPRASLYFGGTYLANWDLFKGAFGPNLGLRTKKGLMVEYGFLMHPSGVKQHTIALKKEFIRF